MDSLFHSSLGLQLSIAQVLETIVQFMEAAPERRYKITIGTDSALLSSRKADFVSAIVVHRIGNGARYFWRRVECPETFHTLRDRITQEVLISLEAATKLFEAAKERGLPPFDFEIHIDAGENGDTRTMIQELVGMIRAHKFEVKTKPESYAASSVADRHV